MLVIPADQGKVTCDGITRRELLRIGGSALLGLTLPQALSAKEATKEAGGGPGSNKAKSVILIFLQGGPSHLDLWDPKEDADAKSVFKTIPAKVSGMETTELMPNLASVTDKFTFIRSMSYTPV